MIRSIPFPSARLGAGLVCAAVFLGACAKIDTPPPLAKPLHIDLAAPVAEQVDLAWPRQGRALAAEHTITESRDVTLRLPDGQQVVVPADRIAFTQQGGLLVGVHIQPVGGALDHPDALAQTRQLLESNRLLDPALAHTLAGWNARDATQQTARVTIRDVDVQVALTPDTRTGWQATLDFEPRTCEMPAGLDGDPDACLQATPTSTVVAGG
ncbi:conserved exported hypothetical protein [Luteimonas sp. 9C]|uniref:hypothetical protein n=1 Tax=Luteimonas sp. 9C TaxID=2653148 RepID=UPI0012F302EB|nr:hypothetical protein [Luteimonas sp. 9C]VXC17369.1 conserved exported hypothetical protein [Luteimonas sp. 9C]